MQGGELKFPAVSCGPTQAGCNRKEFLSVFRIHLKKKIFASYQGEAKHQLAGILAYFEDLMRGFNADMGQKGFVEIGSRIISR